LPHLLREERCGADAKSLLAKLPADGAAIQAALEASLRATIKRLLASTQGSFSFDGNEDLDPWASFSLAGSLALCPRGLQAQYLAMDALRTQDECTRNQTLQPATRISDPNRVAQALMGEASAQDDDWSDLLGPASPPQLATQPNASAWTAPTGPEPLKCMRDILRAIPQGDDVQAWSELALRALRLHCERGVALVFEQGGLRAVGGYWQTKPALAYAALLARISLVVPQDNVLSQVWQQQSMRIAPIPMTAANQILLEAMGGAWHDQPVVLAPLVIGTKTMVLLLGDNPSGGAPLADAPALDILNAHAARRMVLGQ
jgi:hypothetical protein